MSSWLEDILNVNS